MLLVELNRIASHLLFQATNGLDLGAVSMIIYGWRDRELTLRLLETITGLRMNNNFIRPGGVAADLPDGWREDVLELCTAVERRRGRVRPAAHREPDLARATLGVGVITTQQAIALNATGPICGPPASHGTCAGRSRTSRTTMSTSTDLHAERRTSSTYQIRLLRDPRVDQDRAPVRGAHARGRLPRAGPQDHTAAAGRASTSRWKRSSITSSSSPRASACLRARPTSPSSRRAVRSGAIRVRRNREAVPAAHPRAVVYNLQFDGRDVPVGCSPTASRSSRASIRSWGRSTASAVHPANLDLAANHCPLPGEEVCRPSVASTSRRTRTVRHAGGHRGTPTCSTSRPRSCWGRAPSTPCSTASRSGSSWSRCARRELSRERRPDLLEHLQRRYAADGDVHRRGGRVRIAACDLAPVLQVNYEFDGPLTGPSAEQPRRRVQGGPPRGRHPDLRVTGTEQLATHGRRRASSRSPARVARRLVDHRRRARQRRVRRGAKALGMAPEDSSPRGSTTSGLRGRGGAGRHRPEVVVPAEGGVPALPHGERRRGRAVDVQGRHAGGATTTQPLIEGIVMDVYASSAATPSSTCGGSSRWAPSVSGRRSPRRTSVASSARTSWAPGSTSDRAAPRRGCYIAGDETGLLSSLEGERGHAAYQAAVPRGAGRYAAPTIVNNVETMSTVPHIVNRGGEWYASMA